MNTLTLGKDACHHGRPNISMSICHFFLMQEVHALHRELAVKDEAIQRHLQVVRDQKAVFDSLREENTRIYCDSRGGEANKTDGMEVVTE